MSPKQRETYISFLTEKLEMILRKADGAVKAGLAGPNAATLTQLIIKKRPKRDEFEKADTELEMMSLCPLGRRALDEVANELNKKFGFGRIAADPEDVIQQVLLRRKIRCHMEFRVVLGMLAYLASDGVSPGQRRALEKIVMKYQW